MEIHMIYKYDGKDFYIKINEEEGFPNFGKFHVVNSQPYSFNDTNSFEEMKKEIKTKYDQYHSKIPKDKAGWIDLFSSCIIRDGYEDWYIDEDLAMRVLELYKNHSV
jgi:hypothetical protein